MARRRKLSVGLWTVGYKGVDPFGGPILDKSSVIENLNILIVAKKAGWIDYFSPHDDDIVTWDPNNPNDYLDEKSAVRKELAEIKAILVKGKLPVNMMTCSLHGHPIFANGGFTNPNPVVRMMAVKKAMRAAWIGNYLGATQVTYWVARDGFESPVMISPDNGDPYTWLKEALDTISSSCQQNNYSIIRGTIEPKANEPRGFSFLPLVGSALAFISKLDNPAFWGVNPEIPQHSAMVCASPFLEIQQAVWAEKLFFLHVGGQISGQFDNDFPLFFGPDNCKVMVHIFRFLEESGWEGIVEFDCHALRSDLAAGKENYREIMLQFLAYNARMYRMIEQILVPRILANVKLSEAVLRLSRPEYLGRELTRQYEDILSSAPGTEKTELILNQRLPVKEILMNRQNVLAAEEQFNLSLYGVTEEMLDMVMANE
ncbi:MAG: TIM barrel protein [Patescibacteria group bacterium]|nr:TIM barrel protein [Patescibacteria group bacterium]